MVSGNCPTCNNLVDRSAEFCPQCGRTDFLIRTGHQKLRRCFGLVQECEGGIISWFDRFGNKEIHWDKCQQCKGKGVISEPYMVDVRDGLTETEIKVEVENYNKQVLKWAKERLEKELAKKSEIEKEYEKERKESRRSLNLCEICGEPLGISGWFGQRRCKEHR